ncbi:hypothetical protein B7463_g3917, partial [Scytalidium lignicola]
MASHVLSAFFTFSLDLSVQEALSGIFGSISLATWIFLLVPQLILNYRTGSADGAIWAELVPTVIALAVYFCLADFVLITQCLYYNHINATQVQRHPSVGSVVSEEEPLLSRRRSSDTTGLPGSHRRRSSARSGRRDSLSKILEEDEDPNASSWLRNAVSIGLVMVVGAVGWAIAWRSGIWSPVPEQGHVPEAKSTPVGAEILGYFSAVCYLGARIPQILKNYRDKSCEGLALLFFLLSLLGNATYGAGILSNIQTTSSLRSSPNPPLASAEDGTTEVSYQYQLSLESPTLSSSSTADGGSSPLLPPLPAPTFLSRTLDFHRTPPSTSRSEGSSRYYTASWGSPYQQPADPPFEVRSRGPSSTVSSETSGDSPIRHLEFHTPFLRPAPSFSRSQTPSDFGSLPGPLPVSAPGGFLGVSAAVLINRARRPAEGLTEDWIRQHTGGESTAEKYNWLSDDPGDSEHSSLSGSISEDTSDWLDQETDPRTPTLKSFLSRREVPRSAYKPNHHRRRTSTETVKPEDFEDSTQDEMHIMSATEDSGSSAAAAGTEADLTMVPSIDEKPLPPPPTENSEDGPGLHTVSLSVPGYEVQPSSVPIPTASPIPGPPRTKKKVPWKGKNIVVLLPWDEERGQPGNAPAPMTSKAVAAMLREWEQLGYNTVGFDLGETRVAGGHVEQGQSRSLWPISEDMLSERQKRQFRVSIPDKKEWDAYVIELNEAKLRALGVSFGEEPVATISPATSMSRQTSMQYPPLPFSPPIPTSSAASSHVAHHNLFSPALVPGPGVSTSQSSNPGSIASPASLQALTHGKFNPRRSTSISVSGSGTEHPYGSPFQFPQQSSPGVWSPQHMLFQQGAARGGSPSVHNSAFAQDSYFQPGDVVSQLQMRQQQLQNQFQHQHQLSMHTPTGVSSPLLQEVREMDDEDMGKNEEGKSASITPDASQNVKHNLSSSLQQEIDDAEYHLEEQFQRQLEHEDYSPHSTQGGDSTQLTQAPTVEKEINGIRNNSSLKGGLGSSRFADESDEGPVLHHPQPHSRGHSLSQQPFQDSAESSSDAAGLNESKLIPLPSSKAVAGETTSDIETNPSNLGTPVKGLETSSSGHDRSMSLSSNPWANPNESSKGFNNASRQAQHSAKTSFSKLNVAAKEFKFEPSNMLNPTAFSFTGNNIQPFSLNSSAIVPPQSTFNHFRNQSLGGSGGKINVEAPAFTPRHSDFSFSAIGPTFRPQAPAFTPSSLNFSASVGSAGIGASHTPIFSDIDLSSIGISKPSKKSKAIPIIRPDSSQSRHVEDDTLVDSDGRVTQGEGRFKRARGAKDDGDSVPIFAEPSMPLSETSREQSPPKEVKSGIVSPGDKENVTDFSPWEFQNQKQAEDFNAARPFTTARYGSSQPTYEHFSSTDERTGAEADPSKSDLSSKDEAPKKHKKNSLSATAKPFVFRPGSFNFNPVEPEIQKAIQPEPTRRTSGLSSSKYALSPPPQQSPMPLDQNEGAIFQASLPPAEELLNAPTKEPELINREPTFEEIDAIMATLNEAEFESNINREVESPAWYQPTPSRNVQMPIMDRSPFRLEPQNPMRSDAPSPSPRRFQALPGDPTSQQIFSRPQDDPFTGPGVPFKSESPVRRLNRGDSLPASEWDDVISAADEAKLGSRSRFFDSHVNELVGGLLAERLNPLEKILETMQISLGALSARPSSSRRDGRSLSAELAESDADDEDEDDETLPQRSTSPRRDRKLEKIRTIVTEALAAQQSALASSTNKTIDMSLPTSDILKALEDMKEQFGQSMRLDFRGEDLRNVVEEAVEKRMPVSPQPTIDEAAITREAAAVARIAELEENLRLANSKTDEEIQNRRAAEDRLAEVQRLLRISSEEEVRLRETVDEKDSKIKQIIDERDQKVRSVEESRAKTMMRITMLEAVQDNATKGQSDLSNRLSISENELREARKEVQRWQMEAEKASEKAKRHIDDAEHANETNKQLRRAIESLRLQMEESIRVREGMRGKFNDLQEDMAKAAREISQENAHRAKKEQELIARQEVLDARLQAEARTRERLEREIERLEGGEKEGMRAVSECKKLEAVITELKAESHQAQKDAMRYKRDFEEARESGAREVQRTKQYMQAEIESTMNEVNESRDDMEKEISRLRGELDQVRLDADTAREKHDMFLEEANASKRMLVEELKRKHADRIEDMQTQHERQLSNAIEDAQRSEQHLLERLSLSTAKTEHLQDKVSHLGEKLQIAQAAANAAAKAARSVSVSSSHHDAPYRPVISNRDLPEKISPQALRESIMVLQDQLQDREQTIEKLEQQLSTVDLDAPNKVSKRDDEIMWLRELLAVRKSDLQDIIDILSTDEYDPNAVKDAAIRLKANLQMEEQERERAMNGGSSLSLPNIAASLRDAATPRVAQAVGPLAAAWGSWRKSREPTVSETSGNGSTPSKSGPGAQSFLSGLLTPPASSLRQTPPSTQPTAFGNTGQRFTAQQQANRTQVLSSRRQEKMPVRSSPRRGPPSTPPMMRKSSYDTDARAENFSDAGFYDDDESTVDDNIYGANFGQ